MEISFQNQNTLINNLQYLQSLQINTDKIQRIKKAHNFRLTVAVNRNRPELAGQNFKISVKENKIIDIIQHQNASMCNERHYSTLDDTCSIT